MTEPPDNFGLVTCVTTNQDFMKPMTDHAVRP